MRWQSQHTIQPVFICPAMTDVYIGFPAMRALQMVSEKFLQPNTTAPAQVQAMEIAEGGAKQGPDRLPPQLDRKKYPSPHGHRTFLNWKRG